jgi:hypothetical protein
VQGCFGLQIHGSWHSDYKSEWAEEAPSLVLISIYEDEKYPSSPNAMANAVNKKGPRLATLPLLLFP